MNIVLKALFNNVFTSWNMSCMSLHAISVFDKVYKWSPEEKKLHLKIDKWPDLSYSFLPYTEPDRLFSGDIQS